MRELSHGGGSLLGPEAASEEEEDDEEEEEDGSLSPSPRRSGGRGLSLSPGEPRPTLSQIEALDRAVAQAVHNLQKLQVSSRLEAS